MSRKKLSSWPSFTLEETNAVSKVLLSNNVNYWTGTECREFEKEFAEFSDSKFAIALANGTVALDLALHALGIGEGDEVIVTPRTFIASVSCIVNAGAIPIFADVDKHTQNVTAETIKAVISKRTRCIICVHLSGWPCDMDPILELAKELNVSVVEDCAQAHGAKYKGKSVGSIGDIGCWSFCQDKVITTGGEGGMVTTNSETLWKKMWSYKDHGKSWDAVYSTSHGKGFRWLHHSFGTNARMTEMQACLGRIQLKRMPEWFEQRNSNAKKILQTANKFHNVRVPTLVCEGCPKKSAFCLDCKHAYYKCYFFIDASKEVRDNIVDDLNEKGVPCFSGSCSEVYLEKAFLDSPYGVKQSLPNAKLLGDTSLMLLCHPTLTEQEIDFFCSELTIVLGQYI